LGLEIGHEYGAGRRPVLAVAEGKAIGGIRLFEAVDFKR